MNTVSILRAYRKYFARYLVVRLMRVSAVRIYWWTYHVKCRLLGRFPIRRWEIISMGDAVGPSVRRARVVEPSQQIVIPSPSYVGHPGGYEGGKPMTVESPAIEIAEVSGATAIGGGNFVLSDGRAIFPDLVSPGREVFPAEAFGRAVFDGMRASVKLYLDHAPRHFARAINLLGQGAGNYAHWMTEILPKIVTVARTSEYDALPVLVDSWSHPNLREAVSLLCGGSRQIIEVGRWEPVSVDTLVEISLPGYEQYVPHGLHNDTLPSRVNLFSQPALAALRQGIRNAKVPVPGRRSRRVYLRRGNRSANVRELDNSAEIEDYLRAQDFEISEPGLMTFAEQVAAYRDADVLVTPVGATVANIALLRPEATALVLAPYYKEGNYFFYSNLAGVLGIDLSYVLGTPAAGGGHVAHRNYSVSIDVLKAALERAGLSNRPAAVHAVRSSKLSN